MITDIANYDALQGDTIDLSTLSDGAQNRSSSDATQVRAQEDASGTFAVLQVNTDSSHWVDVARIDGALAGDQIDVLDTTHILHQIQVEDAAVAAAHVVDGTSASDFGMHATAGSSDSSGDAAGPVLVDRDPAQPQDNTSPGNTGTIQSAAGPVPHITPSSDTVDVASVFASLGIPVAAAEVRAQEDPSNTFATLQVMSDVIHRGDPAAPKDGPWTTLAQLDGVHVGTALNVELDQTSAPQHVVVDWLVTS